MIKISSSVAYFKRTMDISSYAMKLYGAWAIISFLVFGLFGVRSLYPVLKEKMYTIREMNKTIVSLGDNIELLRETKRDIYDNREKILFLEMSMPKGFDQHAYLVELSEAISDTGYSLLNFNPSTFDNKQNSMSIGVTLGGIGDIKKIIDNIEYLTRLTQIEQINYKVGGGKDGGDGLNISLKIFSLGKE